MMSRNPPLSPKAVDTDKKQERRRRGEPVSSCDHPSMSSKCRPDEANTAAAIEGGGHVRGLMA